MYYACSYIHYFTLASIIYKTQKTLMTKTIQNYDFKKKTTFPKDLAKFPKNYIRNAQPAIPKNLTSL